MTLILSVAFVAFCAAKLLIINTGYKNKFDEVNIKLKYVIYKHIGAIAKPNNGWVKELNFISWNDREPVYDIRTWNSDHSEYGKGVTITLGEMKQLKELIDDIDFIL